jgi:hypothetical protein
MIMMMFNEVLGIQATTSGPRTARTAYMED